jgi:hypothetical protein
LELLWQAGLMEQVNEAGSGPMVSHRQLTKEQQEHSGTVTGTTVNVQYAYDSGSMTNEIRLSSITSIPAVGSSTTFTAAGWTARSTLNRITNIQDNGSSCQASFKSGSSALSMIQLQPGRAAHLSTAFRGPASSPECAANQSSLGRTFCA